MSDALHFTTAAIEEHVSEKDMGRFINEYIRCGLDMERTCQEGGFTFARAIQLQSHPLFKQKLQEVMPDGLALRLLSPMTWVSEIAALAFADATELLEGSGHTLRVKDVSDLDWMTKRAVKKVKITQSSETVVTEITMYDKIAALALLKDLLFKRDKRGAGNVKTVSDIDAYQSKILNSGEADEG